MLPKVDRVIEETMDCILQSIALPSRPRRLLKENSKEKKKPLRLNKSYKSKHMQDCEEDDLYYLQELIEGKDI